MTRKLPDATSLDFLHAKLSSIEDGIEIDDVGMSDRAHGAVDFRGHMLIGITLCLVVGRLVRREADGVIVLSGLGLYALRPADTALTGRVLQQIPRERLLRHVQRKLHEGVELDAFAEALGIPELPTFVGERERREHGAHVLAPAAPPRGRRGTPLVFYDNLALEAVSIATSGRPVQAELAARRGRPLQTIKRWIKGARENGALDPGRAVWKLGPRLLDQSPHEGGNDA